MPILGDNRVARLSASISHFLRATFRPCPVCENLDFEGPRSIIVIPDELRPGCPGCCIVRQALQFQVPAGLFSLTAIDRFIVRRGKARGPLTVRPTLSQFPEVQIFADPYV